MKIGIIGLGFVGGAIKNYLSLALADLETYDLKDGDAAEGYSRVVNHSDIIYVCVPTPMGEGGRCNLQHLEEALGLINHYAVKANKMPLVLVKSTMVPGSSVMLQEKYPHMVLVTHPEFLTERRAFEDVSNTEIHVVGCPGGSGALGPVGHVMTNFLNKYWPGSKTVVMTPTEAELLKYMTNTYFAVKVSFANHMYQLCKAIGIEYDQFIEFATKADPRLGTEHWQVPGHDGKLGFGGKCFPKDLNGMITLFRDHGVDASLLHAAWNYNEHVRQEKTFKGVKLVDFTEEDWIAFNTYLAKK